MIDRPIPTLVLIRWNLQTKCYKFWIELQNWKYAFSFRWVATTKVASRRSALEAEAVPEVVPMKPFSRMTSGTGLRKGEKGLVPPDSLTPHDQLGPGSQKTTLVPGPQTTAKETPMIGEGETGPQTTTPIIETSALQQNHRPRRQARLLQQLSLHRQNHSGESHANVMEMTRENKMLQSNLEQRPKPKQKLRTWPPTCCGRRTGCRRTRGGWCRWVRTSKVAALVRPVVVGSEERRLSLTSNA